MAIHNYRRAIACDAEFFRVNNNLSNALKEAGKVHETIDCCHINHPQILSNLGCIYIEKNMMSTAAQCFNASLSVALACTIRYLMIHFIRSTNIIKRMKNSLELQLICHGLAFLLVSTQGFPDILCSDDVESAIKSYRQALMLCPDFPRATCLLLDALQCVCDWDNQEEIFIKVEGILRREIEMSFIPSVQPLQATAYPLDTMLSLDISRKHAEYFSVIAACYSFSPFTHPPPLLIKCGDRKERLRVE
ncbi:hypothetical protein T459_14073 [Capsicum annuum]|uniref:Uncharacterized protein n=1 Tax=Capsicum annuum TaxID=4072 RepID=A0A2G2ZGE0_CAPAN|nr:hypothetical protein T459_14073 [Capsicum annuum]